MLQLTSNCNASAPLQFCACLLERHTVRLASLKSLLPELKVTGLTKHKSAAWFVPWDILLYQAMRCSHCTQMYGGTAYNQM